RSSFPKRSPAFPRVRRPPIRALVPLGRFLQRLRPLAPALLAQSQAQWRAQSTTQRLAHTWAKEMLAPPARFRSRRFLAPAQLPVRRMILRNQHRPARWCDHYRLPFPVRTAERVSSQPPVSPQESRHTRAKARKLLAEPKSDAVHPRNVLLFATPAFLQPPHRRAVTAL